MFICIKDLYLDKYDENEEVIENEKMEVKEGSEWVLSYCQYRDLDGEIRLNNENAEWIEIDKNTFKEHFVEIQ